MERLQKSQFAKIFLLLLFVSLFLLTPFVSTSMRPSYVYFVLNLLIIVLGIEAGFLASISKPRDERKSVSIAVGYRQPGVTVEPLQPGHDERKSVWITVGPLQPDWMTVESLPPGHGEGNMQPVKPSPDSKKPVAAEVGPMPIEMKTKKKKKTLLKRCSSRPSLFFIGGCDEGDQFVKEEEEEEEEEEKETAVERMVEGMTDISKQELFMKAEMFIGNFYKQLKMQREKSWKQIHGLCHRAF